jgi:acyl-CoA thioesterase
MKPTPPDIENQKSKIENPSDHLIQQDRLAQLLGMRILELSAGRAKVAMEARPEHCNGLGIVHGGALFSLADFAFAAACNSHGHPTVGINANISYLKAAKPGPLFAEATEAVNSKIGLCNVRITDEEGTLLALFQGLSYRKA